MSQDSVALGVCRIIRRTKTPASTSPANTKKAASDELVAVRTRPISSGPKKPPRLPIELIQAMPTAAAVPDRNAGGSDQKTDIAERIPDVTMARQINDGTAA